MRVVEELYTSHLFAAPWSFHQILSSQGKKITYFPWYFAYFWLLFPWEMAPTKVMWSWIYWLFRLILLGSHGPLQRCIEKNGWVYEGGEWQVRSHLKPAKRGGVAKLFNNPLPIIQLKKILTTPGPPPLQLHFPTGIAWAWVTWVCVSFYS